MADHKYIRREGTRGNYKYIYEEDLKNTRNYYNTHTNTKAGHKVTSGEVQGPPEVSKEYLEEYRANTKKNDYTPHIVPANNTPKAASNQNHTFTLGPNGTTVPVSNAPQKKESKNPFAGVGKAVSGFGKGVASSLNSAGKGIVSTANAAGKGISSAADKAGKGMKVAANGARRDIKNAGSKLVMGANGAVEKVKDVAEDVVDNVIDDTAIPAARALDKAVKNVKNATLKVIDDNKTVTKSGADYVRLYGDNVVGFDRVGSVKGRKKDVQKFDKVYQTDAAKARATANADKAWNDMDDKGLKADKLRYDYDTKQQEHIMDDDWEKHDPEVMKKKYPYLAKRPGRKYEAIFDTDSKYPVSTPKALRKDFDEMMDAAEAYAKAKDHKDRASWHEELATRVRDKAYDDYDKSGARKRILLRAKAE